MALVSRRVIKAFAASTVLVFLAAMVVDSEARPNRGGSSGNRGTRTESAVPSTPTAPRTTQPSATNPSPSALPQAGAARPQVAAQAGSRMGNIAKGFAAGLIGAGLFGLLSGGGFLSGLGSLAGIMGFLLQLGLIFLAVKLVMGFIRSRQNQQAAPANVPVGRVGMPEASRPMQAGGAEPVQAQPAPVERQRHDAVGIVPDDYQAFEQSLVNVMQAYSNGDMVGLRRVAMPEIAAEFAKELHAMQMRGEVNVLGQPKLLQGDLAESWFEEQAAYATVAMRYAMTDVTRNRATGAVISGNADQPEEIVEIWTFRREGAGRPWMLTGIDQA